MFVGMHGYGLRSIGVVKPVDGFEIVGVAGVLDVLEGMDAVDAVDEMDVLGVLSVLGGTDVEAVMVLDSCRHHAPGNLKEHPP